MSLLGDHGRIVSGFRTNSTIYIFFNLRQWLKDGRAAYRSANNVVCVYEAILLTYIHNVIDRNSNRELLAEHDWEWLKAAVQANRLEMTSTGRWLANEESAEQISFDASGQSKITLA